MKIFAIYSNVKLDKKPDWLDEFRKKYDKPYEFHITLKQPCYIEEDKVSELKEKISNFFNTSKYKFEVVFDSIVSNRDEDGITIMLKANNVNDLVLFQKDLCTYLGEYTTYLKPKYKGYEKDFVPHITIARNISETQEMEAMKYLQNEFVCGGEINSVTLSIVNNNTPEESKNPANQSIYSL